MLFKVLSDATFRLHLFTFHPFTFHPFTFHLFTFPQEGEGGMRFKPVAVEVGCCSRP